MSKALIRDQNRRKKRAMRVRKKLKGTSLKPRLSVHKSNIHLQAQLIDDEAGVTLVGVSTLSKDYRDTEFNKKSRASAKKIGQRIAELAVEKNIKEVVFDRGSFKYTGVLAELANAAREGGLKF